MYGGAGVLDTRSDVVGGTLYNEEVAYGDQRLVPDPGTAAVVPWAPDTARFICDSVWDRRGAAAARCRGASSGGCSTAAGGSGSSRCSASSRSSISSTARPKEPLFEGYHIFNTVRNTYVPFIQQLVEQLQAFGFSIITANCEYAGSQWEINYTPAHGHGRAGRDLHVQERGQGARAPERLLRDVHVEAVLRLGRLGNAHAREPPRRRGPERLRGRIETRTGSLRSAATSSRATSATRRSAYALLAPTVNCLKRRRPHTFSPSNVSWGLEDRSALVRIKGGSIASRHVEHRAPTALANPYLVRRGDSGRGADRDRGGAAARDRCRGRPAEEDPTKPPLPTSVHESLAALEADEPLRALLGEEFVTAYTVMRRHELQRFDDHVTDWEFDEYVEVF